MKKPYVQVLLVEGRTFNEWLRTAGHSRKEILETLIAAGGGLSAAHRVKVVQRAD